MGLVLRLRWQMSPWAQPVQSWLHTVRALEGLLPTIWSWLRLHFGGTSSCVANLDGDFFEVPLAFVEGEVGVSHRTDGAMGVSTMKGVTTDCCKCHRTCNRCLFQRITVAGMVSRGRTT